MLDIRQIKLIMTLAEHGSLTRAGRILDLSPSALTRALTAIERDLKVELFDRSRRGFEPTAIGRALIQKGAEVLALSDELSAMLARLRGTATDSLQIGAGPAAMGCVVSQAIPRLMARWPGLQLQVSSGVDRVRALQDRKISFAISELSDLAEPEEFQIVPLRRHPLFLLARPGHPLLARGSAIGFEDVLRYPLMRFSHVPARFAPHMAAAMANIEAAAATIPPSMTIEDPAAALAIAAESDALAASTAPQVKPWVQSGALAVVPWRPSWLQTNFGVLYLRHMRLSPLQQDLLDCLQAADAEAFALGQAMMPAGLPPPEEALAVVGRRTAPALIRA